MSPAAWSWLDDTAFGPVAFLLLVPPPPEGDALAAELGLAQPGARLPDIGDRFTILGPQRVAVRGIEITVGRQWASFVAAGGPVAVLVGLEPLPPDAGRQAAEAYIAAGTLGAWLRLGIRSPARSRSSSMVGVGGGAIGARARSETTYLENGPCLGIEG